MLTADSLSSIPGLAHGFFTRAGGVSGGLYASRNCGFGSGDDRGAVAENRARCMAELGAGLGAGGATLVTLFQIHSATVEVVTQPWPADRAPQGDALVTARPGIAIGVLTADCAPVLLADAEAGVIGAAHAGWKGALGGVLDATLAAMATLGARADRTAAAIGPAIGPRSYEVGPEFQAAFATAGSEAEVGAAGGDLFRPVPGSDRLLFDLPAYVARRLAAAGVAVVEDLACDTVDDPARFFSYRRACKQGEKDYGRLLSAIVRAG
ncbi:MAG: peptidoglycan editing factor PgeF [Rhodospirillaceae bacterium]|nr:peptidoglycan editing factor PgeF [Rhodospirillaceae bacterium]